MTDFSHGSAFIGGEFVPISEAKIPILDWGFLHSDATYDVVHVQDGKFFRLGDHLERFFLGMEKLRLSVPYSREDLFSILSRCVSKSGFKDAYVEMIATRGQPEPGSRDPRTCNNRFYAFAVPFIWITEPSKGLNLVISQKQRIPPQSVDPTVKNYHWLDLVMGQFEAYDRGGDTVVVVDAKDNLAEGPGFNIFAVKDDILTTPEEGVLQGITRKTIIELARELGYNVVQSMLSPEAARHADEVFITSTAGGVMAITRIDGENVASGNIGRITKTLQDKYWALHHDPRYTTNVQYES